MQYSKQMIDLVMQIRKLTPTEIKPEIKLANPNLIIVLIDHYHNGANTLVRALVKDLCSLAGESWSDKLVLRKQIREKSVKAFRRQHALDDKIKDADISKGTIIKKTAKKIIYRGQVIYS